MVLLSVAVLVVRFGHLIDRGGGEPTAVASDCPIAKAPAVTELGRDEVGALRAGLGRLVPPGSGLKTYEEGAISANAAWTDEEPGRTGITAAPSQPGAYEMRWWLPRGEDFVDDAFVFATAGEAADFFAAAASVDCRPAAARSDAIYPPSASNLGWLNPDGYAQEDVYFQRERTVYRVAMVTTGAAGTVPPAIRRAAFAYVDALACRLPLAGCANGQSATLVRLRGRRGSGARSA